MTNDIKIIPIEKALNLNLEGIRMEWYYRTLLKEQMVGRLYPSIIEEEIERLTIRYGQLYHLLKE